MYSKVIQIYTPVSILFQILFPYRLLQNFEYSSRCYTIDDKWKYFMFHGINSFKANTIFKISFPLKRVGKKYTVEKYVRPITFLRWDFRGEVRKRLSPYISFQITARTGKVPSTLGITDDHRGVGSRSI